MATYAPLQICSLVPCGGAGELTVRSLLVVSVPPSCFIQAINDPETLVIKPGEPITQDPKWLKVQPPSLERHTFIPLSNESRPAEATEGTVLPFPAAS